MPKLIVALLLLAGLAAGQTATHKPRHAPPAPAPRPQKPLTDEQAGEQLRKRVQEILNAWSTLDPDNAAKYYAKDADLIFFDLTPLAYRGWDEYYLGTKQLFHNYRSLNIRLKDDASLHWMGDMAYATGWWCTSTSARRSPGQRPEWRRRRRKRRSRRRRRSRKTRSNDPDDLVIQTAWR
jgi:ketosteroid isomerase-like protein